jgi:hypothetical protein
MIACGFDNCNKPAVLLPTKLSFQLTADGPTFDMRLPLCENHAIILHDAGLANYEVHRETIQFPRTENSAATPGFDAQGSQDGADYSCWGS